MRTEKGGGRVDAECVVALTSIVAFTGFTVHRSDDVTR